MKTRLHLAITACVVALIIVTTLGANDTTHPIFFVYRTLLVSILHHWHRQGLSPQGLLGVLPRGKKDPDTLRLIALTL